MSEAKAFQCPKCGSALESHGSAAEIKCGYCGNTVIVPEELRAPLPIGEAIGMTPQTTRWIKWSIWGFVILMVLTFVIPLVCGVCGSLVGIFGAFVPFFVK
jgi:DNA-directed RNA polymerase subunit RPC12/RpoP